MEDTQRFREMLYDPLPGDDPDRAPEEVIDEEMGAFKALTAETGR